MKLLKTFSLLAATSTTVSSLSDHTEFYDTYLQEVLRLIKTDDSFYQDVRTLTMEEIIESNLPKLNRINEKLKEDLNNVKRKEVERLRRLIRARGQIEKGYKVPAKQLELNDIATHMDHADPNFFTDTDIERLIYSASQNLADTDTYRHERFKEYAMRKTLEKTGFGENFWDPDDMKSRQDDHRKESHLWDDLEHPGGKQHFLNIWRTHDGMNDDFDPKTFFKLHDTNSDGFWDVTELEILMDIMLRRVYHPDENEDHKAIVEEERLKMREHVMDEIDVGDSADSMISENEFLVYTKGKGFYRPDLDTYEYVEEMLANGKVFLDADLDAYKYKIGRHELDIAAKLDKVKELETYNEQHRENLYQDKLKHQDINDEIAGEFLSERENEIERKTAMIKNLKMSIASMKQNLEKMKEGYNLAMFRSPDLKEHLKGRHMETMKQMAKMHWDL